ncbi:WD40 repeat domain-containing protein [Nannocystaceae bacterium ST9]
MLSPPTSVLKVPALRRRTAPNGPALPLRWQHAPHADRFIQATAISGDGQRIVAASFHVETGRGHRRRPSARDYAVFAYGLAGGEHWRDVCSHYEGVSTLAISREGNTIAAGGWYSADTWSGFVSAWTAEGVRLLAWNHAPARINSVALSADGTTLVAIGEALYLFTRSPGRPFTPEPRVFEVPQGLSDSLALSADGCWIATTDRRGSLYLLERTLDRFAPRHYVWQSPEPGPLGVLRFAAEGRWLACGSVDGTLHVFNRDTLIGSNRPVWSYPLSEASPPIDLALTPDGSRIAVALEQGDGGHVHLLRNHEGKPVLEWSRSIKRPPTSIAIDREGNWVAAADADRRGTVGNYYLFEGASGLIAGSHRCARGCWSVALDDRGRTLIGGSDDGNVYCFATR